MRENKNDALEDLAIVSSLTHIHHMHIISSHQKEESQISTGAFFPINNHHQNGIRI